MAAYIFHNDEFAPSIDRCTARTMSNYFMKRISPECLQVDVDRRTDDRFPVFFKFCSDRRVNGILRNVLGHNDRKNCINAMRALSHDEIQSVTIPFDDKTCTICGEELHVVYSIASLNTPFRKGIMGPQGVHLYERDVPHFGLIYVYRSERTDHETADGELRVQHARLPVTVSPTDILDFLRSVDAHGIMGN